MSNRTKKKPTTTLETYWFTVDGWYREYRFGLNHHPWELSPGHYDEYDTITILGRLRNTTKRKLTTGELYVLPTHVPRSEWSDESNRIGNAWVKEGKLCCSAWVHSDLYYSLPPTLSEHRFKEMVITVSNLRYNKGGTDFIRFHREETELEAE